MINCFAVACVNGYIFKIQTRESFFCPTAASFNIVNIQLIYCFVFSACYICIFKKFSFKRIVRGIIFFKHIVVICNIRVRHSRHIIITSWNHPNFFNRKNNIAFIFLAIFFTRSHRRVCIFCFVKHNASKQQTRCQHNRHCTNNKSTKKLYFPFQNASPFYLPQ